MDTGSVGGSLNLLERMSQVFALGHRCKAYQRDFEVDARQIEQTAVTGLEYLWVVRELGTHLFILGVGSAADRQERELDAVKWLARNFGDSGADWFHGRVKPGRSSVLCGINARRAAALIADAPRRVVQTWHRGGPQRGHVDLATSSGAFAGTAHLHVSNGIEVSAVVELPEGLSVGERMYATLEVELRALMLTGSLFFRFREYRVNGLCVSDARSVWRVEDGLSDPPAAASKAASKASGALTAGVS